MSNSRTHDRGPSSEAVEFVRFCYRRRRIGWPELYDEMCAVAGRGLYRGWGPDELNAEGIGFSLFEMQTLAALVSRVISEERERRDAEVTPSVVRTEPVTEDRGCASDDTSAEDSRRPASLTLAGASAGA